jgi:transposase
MELNEKQYEKIAKYLPRQRGNVSMSNLQLVNAILYVTENGCKWRALPESYGNWHTVYTRMNRWSKNGVLRRLFEALQQEDVIRIRMEAVCLDSTSIKVHPHGTGALKKTGSRALDAHAEDSPQRFIWSPHLTVRLFRSRSHQEMPVTDRKDERY